MRVGKYIELLDQSLWISRILQLTVLVLTIAVLILARNNTIVHVAPPDFRREYWIGPSSASKEYVEQMAAFLITNAMTMSPDSAEYTVHAFLRFLTPEARGKLETGLKGDAAWVKSNAISQAFYAQSIDHYGPAKLRIYGTLMRWTGGKLITSKDMAVELQITVTNYSLLIKDMNYVSDEDLKRRRDTSNPNAVE
jgi:type IV conjugative transfer system protein TraE